MGAETALLDRIDGVLAEQGELQQVAVRSERSTLLQEIDDLLDESMETGIQILPTAPDKRDLAIGRLCTQSLPGVVRQVGMPLSAIAGQRSIL